MADRSIVVRLTALTGPYMTSMAAAAKATSGFAATTLESAATHKQAWDKIGKAAMVGGGLLLAGVAAAVYESAKFDAAMSVVKANVDDKSVPSMQRLADAAMLAGRTTVYSATEAADAENELAKAGLTSTQIIGGALTGALTLAQAGQLNLADAASIAASTMVQFGLAAKDVPHIADLLSAGADKALGGVSDLAEAMKYAGVPAAQFGVSLEQTVGTLAMFAQNGLLGSLAGTGMREMLVRLAKPTSQGAALMREYGLVTYDSQGKFLGLANVAEQLKTKLSGLTQQQQQAALITLFGQRALAESNVLMRAGAKGVTEWTNAVNDQGFAAGQAHTKLDNLNGDFIKLKNSIQVGLIETGKAAQNPLRDLTHDLQGVVDWYLKLDPAAKAAALQTGLVGGAALIAGGALLVMVPKIAETVAALKTLEAESATASMALKGLVGAGVVVGLATIGSELTHMMAQADVTKTPVDALAKSLRDLSVGKGSEGSALDKLFASAGGGAKSASEALKSFGDVANRALSDDLWSKVVRFQGGIGDTFTAQVKQLDAALTKMVSEGDLQHAQLAFQQLTDAATAQGVPMDKLTALFPTYTKAMADATEKARLAALVTPQTAAGIQAVQQAAQAATVDVNSLSKGLKALFDFSFGVEAATDKYTKAMQTLEKQVDKTGHAIDGNSDSALANRAAMRSAADAAFGIIDAYAKTGASSDELIKKAADLKADFIKQAEAAGIPTQAVERYAGAFDSIPALVMSTVKVDNAAAAKAQVDAVTAAADKLNGKTVTLTVQQVINTVLTGAPQPGNVVGTPGNLATLLGANLGAATSAPHAAGGLITGPGSGTSDSILTPTSNGEFIVNAAMTKQYLPLLRALNAGHFTGPGASVSTSHPSTGGQFVGNLYLDSGQLMGVIRGEIRATETANAQRQAAVPRVYA